MAKRGVKPKAIAEKAVTGNPGRRSLKPVVPQAPGGTIPCPDNIVKHERALGYWRHYIATTAPGHLSPVDAPLLAALCYYLAKRDDCWVVVERDGDLLQVNVSTVEKSDGTRETKGGQLAPNPHLTLAKQYTELSRKLAADLSLTVAERNRVNPNGWDGAAGDPADEFF